MFSRILFCVNDPTHADYGWAAESTFLHMRKFDALGNTTAQWTSPVATTAQGEVRCAVCGGEVFIARAEAPGTTEPVMACDFLGHCQATPANDNLARLETLATRLAENPYPADRARLLPVVAALFEAVADNPAAKAILDAHNLRALYPA